MRSLVAVSAACLLVGFAEVKVPTIEQSLGMKTPMAAEISPDGHFVAYVLQQANWEENAFEPQIWIADLATGESYQLTSGKKGSSTPKWSPDSKRLAFGSERDGKRQIYLISPRGGEALPITSGEGAVVSFEWSPDGSSLAYTSSGPEDKVHKDRKDKYGEFEIVQNDYAMNHLWLVRPTADAKDKPKPEALTEGDKFSVGEFSWSPDGARIAFGAQKDPDLSSRATADLYVLRLNDHYVKKLLAEKGPHGNPLWSPDGKEIAYTTSRGAEFFFYTNTTIATVPSDGGTSHLLTEKFDEDPRLLGWSAEGIYFQAQQKTASHLFRIDPKTLVTHRVEVFDPRSVSAGSFTKDHRMAAFIAAAPNEFQEVYAMPLPDGPARKLTNLAAQVKGFQLAKREVISWKSTDGTVIEGILIKPADYDPNHKYPLLVVIHGGPTGVDTPVWNPDRYYPVELFAAKGALILKPNYRGSAGYGEKFRSLNVRNLGLGDYQDVLSGVDSLIAKGLVDRDRVGAMGWSQGGYISAFITTYSDRFKAVSVGAGISDWMTYYVNTDIHPFTRQYLKATPWEDPEIYRKTSPITYVNRAKTPTLIQHGELDKRVPIPNAYELYQALQDRNVPVKMIVYKGFGHGITKPKQQRAVMEHNYEWFSKYIWGEEPVRPTT